MTGHSSSRTVTFRLPFMLPGMQEPHLAGSFEVIADVEKLDVMWDARRSSTRIMLRYLGRIEAFPVAEGDLNEAIEQDGRTTG